MRTAEETTLSLALFITKYKIDSYFYVFLIIRCLINLDWHDSCRNKIRTFRQILGFLIFFFLGSVSMLNKVSLVTTQICNQSTFYGQRAKTGKLVILRSFFIKQ